MPINRIKLCTSKAVYELLLATVMEPDSVYCPLSYTDRVENNHTAVENIVLYRLTTYLLIII